jgi:chitinase
MFWGKKNIYIYTLIFYWKSFFFIDASQAYKNGKIDATLKSALKSGEVCDNSFTFPTCTAPAYQSGGSYPGGTTVSYK